MYTVRKTVNLNQPGNSLESGLSSLAGVLSEWIGLNMPNSVWGLNFVGSVVLRPRRLCRRTIFGLSGSTPSLGRRELGFELCRGEVKISESDGRSSSAVLYSSDWLASWSVIDWWYGEVSESDCCVLSVFSFLCFFTASCSSSNNTSKSSKVTYGTTWNQVHKRCTYKPHPSGRMFVYQLHPLWYKKC